MKEIQDLHHRAPNLRDSFEKLVEKSLTPTEEDKKPNGS